MILPKGFLVYQRNRSDPGAGLLRLSPDSKTFRVYTVESGRTWRLQSLYTMPLPTPEGFPASSQVMGKPDPVAGQIRRQLQNLSGAIDSCVTILPKGLYIYRFNRQKPGVVCPDFRLIQKPFGSTR